MPAALPLNQIAFAVLDLRRTEAWWREGLGFLPAGGNRALFRPPFSDGKVQKLPGSAMTCWCMLGRNDWAQLEFFQYENPISALMPHDYRPCDLGYSRCAVWVEDFDAALTQLAALGTEPLAAPMGTHGKRRACVRNPDGVYVELMEDDPLPKQTHRGRSACPVAIRSATLSTPDIEQTANFLRTGLGMRETDIVLHSDAHEALWGLDGASCTRRVFIGGTKNETMLLEVVQYHDPLGQPLPKDYRLCDQRILNICFGDPKTSAGVMAVHKKALKAGATQNSPPLNLGVVGCVYIEDPLGFSYELMWASPGWAQRKFGFVPTAIEQRPPLDNQSIEASLVVNASPKKVFALLADHEGMSTWAGLGRMHLDKTGSPHKAGRGAERVLTGPLGDVREQITEWQPGKGYRYRIIDGGPFVGYWGEVELARVPGGTRIDWTMRFRSRIPGLGGLLRTVLSKKLRGALNGLQRHIEKNTVPSHGD